MTDKLSRQIPDENIDDNQRRSVMRCLLRSLTVILCLWVGLDAVYAQRSKEAVRWFELRGTEIRGIKSKITNQEYELIINLPYSYRQDTTKRYPVVYFCDGFYDFALLSMIYYDKLRLRDYSPTPIEQYGPSGGAPEFLKVVEQEFIPLDISSGFSITPTMRGRSRRDIRGGCNSSLNPCLGNSEGS